MPNEPWLWAVALILGAVVLLVALVKGGAVDAQLNPPSLKFRAKEQRARSRTSVLDRGEVEDSEIGDVVGVQSHTVPLDGDLDIEVAKGAKITGSRTGDFIGMRVGGGKPKADV